MPALSRMKSGGVGCREFVAGGEVGVHGREMVAGGRVVVR